MANEIIRPTQLPARADPVATEVVPSDNGATVGGVTWANGVNAAVPPASQPESEAGVINTKRMTPLTTKQAIDVQVPPKISSAIGALNLGTASQSQVEDFATAVQGTKADSAVQPSDLAVVATSGDYEDLVNKPTARLLPSGGLTSQALVKRSDADYDTEWVTSAAATAVSYAPQVLTSEQKGQALANIGAGTYRWNWIINGDFTINQRGGVKKPADGVYGYDRWKGHDDGIEQVVEALPDGEYTLTWAGGGNGTFGGMTGPSPIKATVTAGNRSVVVPETSTKVSLVKGDATAESDPFVPRHIQQELALCQRYYEVLSGFGVYGYQLTSVTVASSVPFKVSKRVIPTLAIINSGTMENANTPMFYNPTTEGALFGVNATTTGVVGTSGVVATADAEI